MSIRTELIEQAEAQEPHQDTAVVLQEIIAADTVAVLEHQALVPQDQAAGLPYQELRHIEILVLAQEVILQVEVLAAALEAATITLEEAALEVAITAQDEAVLAVVLIEAQVAALEVLAAGLHLGLLVHLEAVVAEETKIEHLSNLKHCYEEILNFRNTNGVCRW